MRTLASFSNELARRGVQSLMASPAYSSSQIGQPCWFFGKGSGEGFRASVAGKWPACLTLFCLSFSVASSVALTASTASLKGCSVLRRRRGWLPARFRLRRSLMADELRKQPIRQVAELAACWWRMSSIPATGNQREKSATRNDVVFETHGERWWLFNSASTRNTHTHTELEREGERERESMSESKRGRV
jgi:hypothetical protein